MNSLIAAPFQEIQVSTLVEDLQLRYIKALDARNMQGWLDCFAGQACYICTTRENVEQNLPIAMMMDDTRERLEDRAKAVEKVWAGTFEDYRTRHFVQNLTLEETQGGKWIAESNFMVTYTTAKGNMQLLTAGVYVDEIAVDEGLARFISRQAVLDASVAPRYFVYPI